MAVYSVLEPPPRSGGRDAGAERFVFVRDGFSWAAFFFGALWMLWRRLWLVLLGYLVVVGALEFLLRLIGASIAARILIGFLIALLVGLEAASLRRWTLIGRGWRDWGIVVADDLEGAERRFFSAWTATDAPKSAAASPATAGLFQRTQPSAPTGVVGLFPQPGGSR
ncbi:MAG: DUF2628 domain-containing protein [Rhodoplanes sp.]